MSAGKTQDQNKPNHIRLDPSALRILLPEEALVASYADEQADLRLTRTSHHFAAALALAMVANERDAPYTAQLWKLRKTFSLSAKALGLRETLSVEGWIKGWRRSSPRRFSDGKPMIELFSECPYRLYVQVKGYLHQIPLHLTSEFRTFRDALLGAIPSKLVETASKSPPFQRSFLDPLIERATRDWLVLCDLFHVHGTGENACISLRATTISVTPHPRLPKTQQRQSPERHTGSHNDHAGVRLSDTVVPANASVLIDENNLILGWNPYFVALIEQSYNARGGNWTHAQELQDEGRAAAGGRAMREGSLTVSARAIHALLTQRDRFLRVHSAATYRQQTLNWLSGRRLPTGQFFQPIVIQSGVHRVMQTRYTAYGMLATVICGECSDRVEQQVGEFVGSARAQEEDSYNRPHHNILALLWCLTELSRVSSDPRGEPGNGIEFTSGRLFTELLAELVSLGPLTFIPNLAAAPEIDQRLMSSLREYALCLEYLSFLGGQLPSDYVDSSLEGIDELAHVVDCAGVKGHELGELIWAAVAATIISKRQPSRSKGATVRSFLKDLLRQAGRQVPTSPLEAIFHTDSASGLIRLMTSI